MNADSSGPEHMERASAFFLRAVFCELFTLPDRSC